MAKVKAKPTRIDEKMVKCIEECARDNEISNRLASRKLAETLESIKFSGKKLIKEIKF
jgi:hypothetical protein